ncbi:hypothetical protein BHE74_00012089 [Ensete ventricosum]|nr:hypothetical protein BHE74_00012089 [Ensete ventricosum]
MPGVRVVRRVLAGGEMSTLPVPGRLYDTWRPSYNRSTSHVGLATSAAQVSEGVMTWQPGRHLMGSPAATVTFGDSRPYSLNGSTSINYNEAKAEADTSVTQAVDGHHVLRQIHIQNYNNKTKMPERCQARNQIP